MGGVSVAAFQNLAAIRERARRVVEADRALLGEFLERQPRVSAPRTEFGTTAFVHLRDGDAGRFLARLRTEYETSVAPGRFFEMPGHFRIGMGVNRRCSERGCAASGRRWGKDRVGARAHFGRGDRVRVGIRCGGRGSRTYRRALPAANGLSRIFDDRGPLAGGHIVADSMSGSLRSSGTAIGAIRSPKGVMEPIPRSPRRPHPRR